jgi:glycosyltransferase involved in cell wall biosynthesis
MSKADGYVFQTEEARSFYKGKYDKKSVIISNPLKIESLPKPYLEERKRNIVTVGRLHPQKNQMLLIQAFEEIKDKYPDYNLIIYGEGVLRKELQEYINDNKLDSRIIMPGNVLNLLSLIKDSGIFILSSDFEGMPNALIEAMALGLPCISTDCPCGGPKSLIENGENGLLFEVGNKNQLINAIEYMINNPDKAKQMSEKAVNIRNTLNANHICEKWYNYIMSIN